MTTELLITGGAGFIGTHAVRAARAAGIEPVVLDNLFVGAANLALHDPAPRLCEVDLRDESRLQQVIRELAPRRVLHLAALHFIPYCNRNPLEAVEVNLMGTRNLLGALEQVRPESLVFASSAAVYPIGPGPHREDDALGSTDIYGHSKLLGEELLERFSLRTGVPARACRLFNVYGPHETQPHLIPAIVEQLAGGATEIMLGNLQPARDYIHASDIASALLAVSGWEGAGFAAFNVGTGREWTVKEVVDLASQALGRPICITQDPDRMRPSDRLHLVADNSKLREATGWEPRVAFAEGMARLLASSGL